MDEKNNDRMQRKKDFGRAIERPHLLVFAEKIKLKSGKTVYGVTTTLNEPNKLQYSLAEYGDEESLQELINFFNEALERHRKIDRGENAEVIHLNDKPDKGGA